GAVTGLVAGVFTLSWISVGAYLRRPFHWRPPVSVDGCVQLYLNATGLEQPTLPSVDIDAHNSQIEYIYRLSYLWYSFLGAFIVLVLGTFAALAISSKTPVALVTTSKKKKKPLEEPTFPTLNGTVSSDNMEDCSSVIQGEHQKRPVRRSMTSQTSIGLKKMRSLVAATKTLRRKCSRLKEMNSNLHSQLEKLKKDFFEMKALAEANEAL
ncbi:hypothetical protein MRX96_053546, partial [Rhipicephalus microplus]